tara:strand:- start:918 stop:1028 length:111 start_codon:yes stop_codon:yes gene_type:complete
VVAIKRNRKRNGLELIVRRKHHLKKPNNYNNYNNYN